MKSGGEESEKLEWFKTINIAGKPLNDQEIHNAVYAGPFVSDAKRHFSKSNCGAYRLGKDLINGTPIRQDFLKKALPDFITILCHHIAQNENQGVT